jgi:hypothetical protein
MRTTRDYNYTHRPRAGAKALDHPAIQILLILAVFVLLAFAPTLVETLYQAVEPWLPR